MRHYSVFFFTHWFVGIWSILTRNFRSHATKRFFSFHLVVSVQSKSNHSNHRQECCLDGKYRLTEKYCWRLHVDDEETNVNISSNYWQIDIFETDEVKARITKKKLLISILSCFLFLLFDTHPNWDIMMGTYEIGKNYEMGQLYRAGKINYA